ncbi:hypothetical protein D3C79_633950 [compost metagenome]
MYHAVTHFTNQHAVVAQVVRRAGQNTAHQLQAIAAGRQAQLWLKAEFLRQIGHVFRIHVRRIGDDQIVLDRGNIAEQIGTDRDHLLFNAERLNIALGHRQHVAGDIDSVNFRFRESVAAGNGDTAAACTHVENMARRVRDEGAEAIVDQFANRGTRNQHTLINVEFQIAEPGFVGQIGYRDTFVDAADHALNDAVALAGGQTGGVHVLWNIQRQEQAWQHQLHRFVPRIIGSVTIVDIGGVKTAYCPTQHILNGVQFIHCFLDENFVQFALRQAL